MQCSIYCEPSHLTCVKATLNTLEPAMPARIIELERRIANSQDDVEKLDLMLELVDIYEKEDYAEGWRIGSEALDLATKLESKWGMAKSHEEMANCLWKLAEFGDAQNHYEEALDNYLLLGDLHGVGRCYCGMGIIAGSLENFRSALEYFEDGLSAANRAGKEQLSATLTGNIGHVYFNLGNYPQAMRCFDHSYQYYLEVRDEHGAANMLSGMAGIHVYQGDIEKGLELQRRAIQLHKVADHPRGIATGMMNVGIALQQMKQFDKSKKELLAALNYSRSIQLKTVEVQILKVLSEVCSELGDAEASNHYLQLYLEAERDKKKLEVSEKKKKFRMQQHVRLMQQRTHGDEA